MDLFLDHKISTAHNTFGIYRRSKMEKLETLQWLDVFLTPRMLGTSLTSLFSSRQAEQDIKVVKMITNKFIVEF